MAGVLSFAHLRVAGDAAPVQTPVEGGGKTIPADRLGHDQPEAKKNRDQGHAEQQSRVHLRPLPFAGDIADSGNRGASRSSSMASSRGIDLVKGNDDLERDQEHDDDFEAKRAPRPRQACG